MEGGGLVADYYIDILRRPLASYWHTRYGADIKNTWSFNTGTQSHAH